MSYAQLTLATTVSSKSRLTVTSSRTGHPSIVTEPVTGLFSRPVPRAVIASYPSSTATRWFHCTVRCLYTIVSAGGTTALPRTPGRPAACWTHPKKC